MKHPVYNLVIRVHKYDDDAKGDADDARLHPNSDNKGTDTIRRKHNDDDDGNLYDNDDDDKEKDDSNDDNDAETAAAARSTTTTKTTKPTKTSVWKGKTLYLDALDTSKHTKT